MNTQLVESIIQVVNALSPEERSLLKQRLLHDDRAQTVISMHFLAASNRYFLHRLK